MTAAATTRRPLPRPSPVEVLACLLLGPDPAARPLPPAEGFPVLAALERAVLPALGRAPCVVSFSGGRDSSAILAVAVDVARRQGLPLPVPVTMRFPGAEQTDESLWQERVLAHLGLDGHEVLELQNEVDALGPAATAALRAHGVRWPSNAYMHTPVLALASGGSLLTGAGGDELLATRGARHILVARRRQRARPGDLRWLAFAVLPRPLRAALWRAVRAPSLPWLSAEGSGLVKRGLAREEVGWPHRWDSSVRHWYGSRAFSALDGAVAALAAERGVTVVNPFLDPGVLAELTRVGGPTGFNSRSAAMRELFGELLPAAVLTREAKAGFSEPFWGPASRAFAAEWDGAGVEARHVDLEALRREWLSDRPDFRTSLLLHAAWLSASSS